MPWIDQNPIRVATHGCPHHLDELAAICLLRRWAKSRGQTIAVHFLARHEIPARCGEFDVLIDIGQEFDAARGHFDHHQDTPEVRDRASAGLVFDTLYADDPCREYLEPIIRHVDAIDAGGKPVGTIPETSGRGPGMVSIPALLKAVGGFDHHPPSSQRCLGLVAPLVESWFRQADAYRQAADVVAAAARVGDGIFLETDGPYGPGLLEYVQRETELSFVGFPAEKDRFHVVAVRDRLGHNRVTFAADLPEATFVHPQGFLVVFPGRDAAHRALRS